MNRLQVNKPIHPRVIIVTPVFNGRQHTEAFLNSLKTQNYPNFETVIIDDGSTDGTAKMIEEKFPQTVVLKGNGNLWWSGSTNLGVEYALKHQANFVLTINNDVTIPDDYISNLVKRAALSPRSLIGSIIFYHDDPNRVWYCGAYFDRIKGETMHHSGRREDFTEVIQSEWLTGMGVLVPVEAYLEVGLYDKVNFPQYFGDAEFSVRSRQKGYNLIIDPSCEVYADVDSSWVLKQVHTPKLRFLWDLFFSMRSPYYIPIRYAFYKKYWPRNYVLALLRLYFVTMLGLYLGFTIALIKQRLGVKSLRRRRSNNKGGGW
jgi:GT2 family glycosyltransferase